jgi:hypothetical protein
VNVLCNYVVDGKDRNVFETVCIVQLDDVGGMVKCLSQSARACYYNFTRSEICHYYSSYWNHAITSSLLSGSCHFVHSLLPWAHMQACVHPYVRIYQCLMDKTELPSLLATTSCCSSPPSICCLGALPPSLSISCSSCRCRRPHRSLSRPHLPTTAATVDS